MSKRLEVPLYLTKDYASLDEEERSVAVSLREKGYAVLKSFIPDELIDRAIKKCEGSYQSNSRHLNANRRLPDGWRYFKEVREVACNPNLIKLLSKVYGRRAFPFQTLNFEVGTEQRLHSDAFHFQSIPNLFMSGVWVAFEKTSRENGALRYVEGSHLFPFNSCDSIGISTASVGGDPYEFYSGYEAFIEQLVHASNANVNLIEMEKGDVLIWSANLIHGGSPILDPKLTRKSQVTHYFYDDCVYFSPIKSDLSDGKFFLRQPTDIFRSQKIPLLKLFKNLGQNGYSLSTILRSFAFSKLGL